MSVHTSLSERRIIGLFACVEAIAFKPALRNNQFTYGETFEGRSLGTECERARGIVFEILLLLWRGFAFWTRWILRLLLNLRAPLGLAFQRDDPIDWPWKE